MTTFAQFIAALYYTAHNAVSLQEFGMNNGVGLTGNVSLCYISISTWKVNSLMHLKLDKTHIYTRRVNIYIIH